MQVSWEVATLRFKFKSLNFEIDKMIVKKDGLRVETGLHQSLPPPSTPELPPPVTSILGEAPPVFTPLGNF